MYTLFYKKNILSSSEKKKKDETFFINATIDVVVATTISITIVVVIVAITISMPMKFRMNVATLPLRCHDFVSNSLPRGFELENWLSVEVCFNVAISSLNVVIFMEVH